MEYYDQLQSAADVIRRHLPEQLQSAVVLGSGLGDFAGRLREAVSIRYDELPHWPASRVAGHEGRLVIGRLKGRQVAALSGRCHAYEGHDQRAVVFAVRVLGLLGVRTLVLTNAAGGINAAFESGVLMAIDDHINLTGSNPLVGPNDGRLGLRFPDMTEVYSARLRRVADETAASEGLRLHHGVYAGVLGPSYETPAEIRFLRTIGADAVGMSTVPEAIAARHMGIEVLGISCVTNMAAGVHHGSLFHEDVLEATARARDSFFALLEGVVGRL